MLQVRAICEISVKVQIDYGFRRPPVFILAGIPMALESEGTFFVTTEPAPVIVLSPISIGATNMVLLPMNAPDPILVPCLECPS